VRCIKDVDSAALIKNLAETLKNEKILEMPDWAHYVKTGVSRERPPEDPNWWYVRGASILRRIYLDGPIGTQRLRTYYGGRKNYGHGPSHFGKGGGKIIRTILRQLEKAELIKQSETKKKGRVISPKGQKFLDNAIMDVVRGKEKVAGNVSKKVEGF